MESSNQLAETTFGSGEDTTDYRDTWRRPAKLVSPKQPCLTAMNGSLVGRSFHICTGRLIVGRGEDCELVLLDEGVSRRHAIVVCKDDGSVFLEDLRSTNGTAVDGRKCEEQQLLGGERVQFGSATIFKFEFRDEIDNEFATYLYESATRDRLTGVFNRRYLSEQLLNEFIWHQRHEAPLSVIFLDLDEFKSVNDEYGHLCGDEILRQSAGRMLNEKREEDLFARYGGEEFACLLRRTPLTAATLIAERMRRAVEAAPFMVLAEGAELNVSISAGVAQTDPKMRSFDELLDLADRRLYEAKAGGRNRVVPAMFDKS